MRFKRRPKDVERLIEIWGWMDDVVRNTKTSPARSYWTINGIPKKRNGSLFAVKIPISKGPVTVDWEALAWNRFWFKEAFEKCSWAAICRAFVKTMAM